MTQRVSFVHLHEEGLVRFPGLALVLYRFWFSNDLLDNFDADKLFSTLIDAGAYQSQRYAHSQKGEHGPFDVAKLLPEHYEPISCEELQETLRTRLIPASEAQLERYLDPWPSIGELRNRLDVLLDRIQGQHLHCYQLAIHLEEKSYWSDRYREIPILEHFEEWVAVDTDAGMIHMLQLIRD